MGDKRGQLEKPKEPLPASDYEALRKFLSEAQDERVKAPLNYEQPRPQFLQYRRMSTIQCHQPQSSYELPRLDLGAFKYDRTTRQALFESWNDTPPEVKFEDKWAKVSDKSPLIKANEVLKQLPEVKISTSDPEKMAKMLLVIANTDLSESDRKLLSKLLSGVKSVEKSGGNTITIDRDGVRTIPLPEKIDVGAGITIDSIKLGCISCQLGDGSDPQLRNLKGITVELTVPTAVSVVGGVKSSIAVDRLEIKQDPNSGCCTISIRVENPVPYLQRTIVGKFVDGVPQGDFIAVPVVTLDRNGKPTP